MFRVMVLRGRRARAGRVPVCRGRRPSQGVLTVKRPILLLGGKLHEEATAKSKAGGPLVSLDAETGQLLREHRKDQIRARMKVGEAWQDNDLISCQPDRRPRNPVQVSKRLKRLAA